MAYPSPAIISAFYGGRHPPKATLDTLSGGPYPVYRVGSIVLKKVQEDQQQEAEWTSLIYEKLKHNDSGGFRVPKPIRSSGNERFVYDGWKAFEYVPEYQTHNQDWDEILAATTKFHEEIRSVKCPDWLTKRNHAWAIADRVAWNEELVVVHAKLRRCFEALCSIRIPVDLNEDPDVWQPQVIHGDCSRNVLTPDEDSDDQDPLILDFFPFYRPAYYAEAIVLVDAHLWYGQTYDDLDELADVGERVTLQMLIRAAIFRLVAHSERSKHGTLITDVQASTYNQLAQWLGVQWRKAVATN